ncbi:MAG: SMP-30/gluconolactonase/LRE family protein [Myxococcota bacterium]
MWILALAACSPDDTDDDQPPPASQTSLPVTGSTPPAPDTADTAATPPAGDLCDALPAGPYDIQSTDLVQTEEDFDFDGTGLVVLQRFNDLVGVDRDGTLSVVAVNIGLDVAGVRTLPSGDVLVTQQDLGRVSRIDRDSGGRVDVANGLGFPNGLEVGTDGWAYVSDYAEAGRVMRFDPYPSAGDAPETILEIAYPNGLALSPDEQTLYVATSTNLFGGRGRVVAIDRDASGAWSAPRSVYQADDLLDAIAVDTCGNVYVTEYTHGKVHRLHLDGTSEEIADLRDVGFEGYCASHFSPGIGTWSPTALYVSNRHELYGIELGVPGRHVLAAPTAR